MALSTISHDKYCTKQWAWKQGVKIFVKLLNSDRELVQIGATITLRRIANFSLGDILEQPMPHLISLVCLPYSGGSPSIQETTTFFLGRLACTGDHLSSTIADSRTIVILVRLLLESEARM